MDTMILAQAAQQSNPLGMLVPMILIFGIFYFMMIRPQQRKEKDRQKQISELRAGQRVVFGGGMIGKVTECKEHTFMIEIANGVIVEVARGSITKTLAEGDAAKIAPA